MLKTVIIIWAKYNMHPGVSALFCLEMKLCIFWRWEWNCPILGKHGYLAQSLAWFMSNSSYEVLRCEFGLFLAQKYSRLRCLLLVKGLVICFYFGWYFILQIRTNIIKVDSKLWLLTCSSNITLSLPSYTVSAL